MVFRCETFRNDKGIVVLQSVKDSHLSIIPNRFYESPKLKNWMCELCTFSQIWSQIQLRLPTTAISIPFRHRWANKFGNGFGCFVGYVEVNWHQ